MTGGAISVFTRLSVMNLGAKCDVIVIMHSHTDLHSNSIQVTLIVLYLGVVLSFPTLYC